MDNPVAKLLAAQTDAEAAAAFGEFGMKLSAGDVRPLLPALSHPNRVVRWHAAYLLGGRWNDKRVVRPLLEVLRNRNEEPEIRGTIADQLAHHRRRRMILPVLVATSFDPDPVVRFWCVFALGSHEGYRRKPSLAAIRALESRLDDAAAVPGWWQVRLEAIAALDGVKKSGKRKLMRETLSQVFADPLQHPDKWRWAEHYMYPDDSDQLESASRKLAAAGVDPVTFGEGMERKYTLLRPLSASATGSPA